MVEIPNTFMIEIPTHEIIAIGPLHDNANNLSNVPIQVNRDFALCSMVNFGL